jgi:hypothetical protein
MDSQQLWQPEPSGTISADIGRFHLVIHAPAAEGFARFLVIDSRNDQKQSRALVASGTEDDVSTAKAAAERMATRLGH